MGVKKNSTYSIDEDIKKDFQVECIIEGMDMSEVVQNMMIHFTKAVRDAREAKLVKTK